MYAGEGKGIGLKVKKSEGYWRKKEERSRQAKGQEVERKGEEEKGGKGGNMIKRGGKERNTLEKLKIY